MVSIKSEVFTALNSLGYDCRQGGQAVFTKTPAITFRIGNHSIDTTLDYSRGREDIEVIVDIFADKSPQVSAVFNQVEEKMRGIGYRLTYSTDVASPEGALFHYNCRFSTVK